MGHWTSEELEIYEGTDLGSVWSPEKTAFRVWAPSARAVWLNLYSGGDPEDNSFLRRVEMTPGAQGTWYVSVAGNLHGTYYTYRVMFPDHSVEACDPYARAVGVNGQRAMVIDLRSTDPRDWAQDRDPHAGMDIRDAILYEVHIRDISMHPSSGIRNQGRYAGLTEAGTTTAHGIPTGVDHIRNLGVTHVQLQPIFDFGSVDEAHAPSSSYNWGYDPMNFNVPEGSYSRDPFHGEVRVGEVKELVSSLHKQGLSVVMDVVYNHVYAADRFCFNQIVPGYFSRENANDSCCGNDTASERPMVRKYIVDSLCYWAQEYHMDGFRLDLAGLIDVVTIREAMTAVHSRHPNVIFYGEGWDMCTAPVAKELPMATQANAHLLPEFGFFNDRIRDLLRGSVFFAEQPGFITGAPVDGAVLAQCYNGNRQSINYVSCHDNHTLFDRIATGAPHAHFAERVRMNKLAAAFVLTARGVPFFLAGEEMLRTKPDGRGGFDHNSFRSGDGVNAIKWDTLEKPEYLAVFHYYQGLIRFRKANVQFRNGSDPIRPMDTGSPQCVAFSLGDDAIAIFNGGKSQLTLPLPPGDWQVFVDAHRAGTVPVDVCRESVPVPPVSAKILLRKIQK